MSLHATGIVHGGALSLSFVKDTAHLSLDLNIGNFGFAFPQIAGPYTVILDLGDHDMIIVLPVSVAHQTPSLPAYVLTPCDLAKYYDKIAGKDVPQTKIIDFGSGEPFFWLIPHFDHFPNRLVTAHEAGKQPPSFQCQTRACAPELAFARTVQKIVNPPVEPPADVWALGAAVCTHSVFILTTILTVNIRFTKFLPMMNILSMQHVLPPS